MNLQALNVPARAVPVPESVSPAARAMLSQWGSLSLPAAPDPADLEAWSARIAGGEAMLRQMLMPTIANLPVTSVPVRMGRAEGYEIIPETVARDGAILLDIHGGGFTSGAGDLTRVFGTVTASQFGLPVYAVDYRMPPAHPYPAALDDCLWAYEYLLTEHEPRDIVVRGISAGANLAAALMLRARDQGLPLPAGLILVTPEVDLTESGDSFQTNAFVDVVLKGSLANANALYAGGHDLSDPYLSPLFGDFTQPFPATMITAGTRDLFLSNAVRLHNVLRRAGRRSELIIEEAMPHGGFFGAPEDALLAADLRDFALRVLSGATTAS